MDSKERRTLDTIREGLVLIWQQKHLAKTGNPYATLGDPGPSQEELNEGSEIIYAHLQLRGLI